jgi:hypothetical protein
LDFHHQTRTNIGQTTKCKSNYANLVINNNNKNKIMIIKTNETMRDEFSTKMDENSLLKCEIEQSNELMICTPANTNTVARFAPLLMRLAMPYQATAHLVMDTFNPMFSKEELMDKICPICRSEFPNKTFVKAHRSAVHPRQLQPLSDIDQDFENAFENMQQPEIKIRNVVKKREFGGTQYLKIWI